MLDVCLLGTSGMQPLPNRHLASAMFRYNGKSLLIDCGEGTQIAIKKKGWSFKTVNVICLTHYHTDHVSGLTGLLAAMSNSGKTDVLTIVGPTGLEKIVNAALALTSKLPFEIQMVAITEKEQLLKLHGFNIETFKVDHSITCQGYSILVPRNGKCDVEKARENGVPEEFWTELQKDKIIEYEGRILTKDLILGKQRKGVKVTYCTDTRPNSNITKNASQADLFICEGMYGDSNDYSNALKNKHMLFSEAAEIALAANVKEMWLTHYSPGLAFPAYFIEEATSIFNNTKLGEDGMSIDLDYVDS